MEFRQDQDRGREQDQERDQVRDQAQHQGQFFDSYRRLVDCLQNQSKPQKSPTDLFWSNQEQLNKFSPWLQQIKDDGTKARCSFCKVTILLGKVPYGTLSLHSQSARHLERVVSKTTLSEAIATAKKLADETLATLRAKTAAKRAKLAAKRVDILVTEIRAQSKRLEKVVSEARIASVAAKKAAELANAVAAQTTAVTERTAAVAASTAGKAARTAATAAGSIKPAKVVPKTKLCTRRQRSCISEVPRKLYYEDKASDLELESMAPVSDVTSDIEKKVSLLDLAYPKRKVKLPVPEATFTKPETPDLEVTFSTTRKSQKATLLAQDAEISVGKVKCSQSSGKNDKADKASLPAKAEDDSPDVMILDPEPTMAPATPESTSSLRDTKISPSSNVFLNLGTKLATRKREPLNSESALSKPDSKLFPQLFPTQKKTTATGGTTSDIKFGDRLNLKRKNDDVQNQTKKLRVPTEDKP